jgi:Ca2+-binding EF-hand superfamily protein
LKYDQDNDGFLSFPEVKKLLNDALGYANDNDTEWFISQLDEDGDKKLSWYEMRAAV